MNCGRWDLLYRLTRQRLYVQSSKTIAVVSKLPPIIAPDQEPSICPSDFTIFGLTFWPKRSIFSIFRRKNKWQISLQNLCLALSLSNYETDSWDGTLSARGSERFISQITFELPNESEGSIRDGRAFGLTKLLGS
mmetsp:Transcript_13183/g.31599  ORF Transcript_13183/g.31599 Transcript_13183/m.31599 type:complete len:135 (+) Transcript_13183:819-1223(+)